MRIAVEHLASESITGVTSYTSTKWTSGSLIKKRTDMGLPFIGPMTVGVARPFETSAAIPGVYPHVISWSSTIDWVFLADNATAAATRRIQAYSYDKTTSTFGWLGFITLTPTATVGHTVRSLRVTVDNYTTGTVGVTGTTVTGIATSWVANRQCVGCRIGFGSTDPTQITTWHYIASIVSDTSLTITATIASTLTPGKTYVIEDMRCVMVTTNTTTTNGGVFVAKGLNINIFTSIGTTIPFATTVDNIRAVYWLADAAVVLNVTAAGGAIDAKTDWTNQDLYVLDAVSAGNAKVFKYNIRKALTLTAGKDTTTLQLTTGTQPITGNLSQTNNGRVGILNHGPANGIKSLYFVSPTRVYCAKLASIINASTTWYDYTMNEVPTGGVNYFTATGTLSCVEIADSIDRLIIMSNGAAGVRSYITQYSAVGGYQFDHIFLNDDKQIDQSAVDPAIAPPHPTILAVLQTPWSQNGVLYLAGVGTAANTNILHAVPVGADWQYASTTGQRLITPKYITPNCNRFTRVYVIRDTFQGSVNLGKPADPFRMYYRTSNIDTDATTGWIAIGDGNDLSGVGASSEIQFMLEFKCISDFCIGSRIFLVGVVYDDLSTDSHYQPSANFSNITTKTFAWRFSTAFGTTVPTLRIRLYDAVLGTSLLDDNTSTPSGTWEKSTNDGSGWSAYNTTDKANETTYIRYTPASLGDNIKVRALLTLN